ncbi:MAG TPA: transcription termination factor Rho [Acidobacteriota bacterium]|nr:transcription termination factor Rho [Acidobacteriota bacterium]
MHNSEHSSPHGQRQRHPERSRPQPGQNQQQDRRHPARRRNPDHRHQHPRPVPQQNAQPSYRPEVPAGAEVEISGVVEILPNGTGFLRQFETDLQPSQDDGFLGTSLIRDEKLETGMLVKAVARGGGQKGPAVTKILEINGRPREEYTMPVPFERQMAVDPEERFILTPSRTPLIERSMRLLELMTPIGKGQRALIVAPPKTGKTTLLHDLAASIADHHPETVIVVLLVDERPEEVTHFKRAVQGIVIASSADKEAASHLRAARLTLEMGRSLAESGKDVFLLLDSITRLGRASNREEANRGKTLSGGVGSRALEFPRRFFGSARNLENGGSLTIVATALIDTGSRMDEVIFQEFKGTGNMELVLDRRLAELRMFPAVDLNQSGSRKEEKILPPAWLNAAHKLRRHLASLKLQDAMDVLMTRLEKAESVEAFCSSIQ